MNQVTPNSLRAWVLAMRPKTLTAALVPVLMAVALAAHDGVFQWQPALLCALFASLMQIASNLINDLYDFQKGTDGADRLGPERACAQGWISPSAMRRGIGVCLLLAVIAGLSLLFWGGWELVAIGVACVIGAFIYTLFFSYWGLGDVLVLVFFGFVPVVATYYVQAGTTTASLWWAGAASGLVNDTLLILNNYRDRDTDRRSGKRTLIARYGEPFGFRMYLLTGCAAFCCALLALYPHIGYHAFYVLLPYLLLHYGTAREMRRIREGRALNRILGKTSRNLLLFGCLFALSLLLARFFHLP